jgi:nucleotide-binding universal stress UspA family protein
MTPIMLATDGSPSAEEATSEAIDLAARLELPLIVVSVAHDSTPGYGYYGYTEIAAEMRKIELDRIGTVLEAVEARAEAAGRVGKACPSRAGGPRAVQVAAGDARLVVIGAWLGRARPLIWQRLRRAASATTPVLVIGDDAAVLDHPPPAERRRRAVGAARHAGKLRL